MCCELYSVSMSCVERCMWSFK